MTGTVLLFTYGTLQLPQVQRAKFGRLVEGAPDSLPAFALRPIVIDDPEVVRLSGQSVHRIAVHTGNPADRVDGTVLRLTPAELAAADAYEVEDYVRLDVRLASGAEAFVYAAREH